MLKKVLIVTASAVFLAGVALIAGVAKQEKKSKQEACSEQQLAKRQPDLLDQLIKAYNADDKEEVGQIIKKMEQRRERIRARVKEGVVRRLGQGLGGRGGPCCCGTCPMAGRGPIPMLFRGPFWREAPMGFGGGRWAAPGWEQRRMMGDWGRMPMPRGDFRAGPEMRGEWRHDRRMRGEWEDAPGPGCGWGRGQMPHPRPELRGSWGQGQGQGRVCPMSPDVSPRDIPHPQSDRSPKSEWDW